LASPSGSLLSRPTGHALGLTVLVLAAGFFLTELGQALIEFRQQAYSFSLSGIPMLLGLLYCPPHDLIAARVLAAVAAFVVQRAAPAKLAFNTAAYLLDTVLVLLLTHLVLVDPASLTPRVAAYCYLSLAAVDLLMSALVLLVIRINDGPVTRAAALGVLVPAAGFVALNTLIGLLCAVLLGDGTLGLLLLVAFVVCTAAVYRGYLVLRGRHQSLQVVQQFIESNELQLATLVSVLVLLVLQVAERERCSAREGPRLLPLVPARSLAAQPLLGAIHNRPRQRQVGIGAPEEDGGVTRLSNVLQRRHKQAIRFSSPGCAAKQRLTNRHRQEGCLFRRRRVRYPGRVQDRPLQQGPCSLQRILRG